MAAISSLDLDGVDTFLRSPNAAQFGLKLHLPSAVGSSEWGLYRFSPAPGQIAQSIDVTLDPSNT
ncbi:MAG: hypothetical protein M3R04_04850, partial [bacterium]|nr:hypothetical protein [bacterium]